MDQPTQIRLMRRIFGFLEARTTELADQPYVNRVSTYTSGEQLARERRHLFGEEPLLVGFSSDVREPGAYFVHEESGAPILVVRQRNGDLRAFLAICRHRGAQLASGAGQGKGLFSCPYHGWTYNEDGKLVSQPCREGFTGLDGSLLNLTPLPLVERFGMIFVRQSAGEIDLDQHLGGAQQELAALGLERYVQFTRRSTEHAMNWKLVVDTFLEAYHVSFLHQDTLSPTIYGSPAAWDAFGRGGRMVAVRRSILEARNRPEDEWNLLDHSVVLYQIFPNTVLIHQLDHIELVQVYPGADVDHARIVVTLYTPKPVESDRAQRHFQRNLDLLVLVTETEDFRIGEQMQRGFRVDPSASVVYGRNEPGLAHYHRMIAATLGENG